MGYSRTVIVPQDHGAAGRRRGDGERTGGIIASGGGALVRQVVIDQRIRATRGLGQGGGQLSLQAGVVLEEHLLKDITLARGDVRVREVVVQGTGEGRRPARRGAGTGTLDKGAPSRREITDRGRGPGTKARARGSRGPRRGGKGTRDTALDHYSRAHPSWIGPGQQPGSRQGGRCRRRSQRSGGHSGGSRRRAEGCT